MKLEHIVATCRCTASMAYSNWCAVAFWNGYSDHSGHTRVRACTLRLKSDHQSSQLRLVMYTRGVYSATCMLSFSCLEALPKDWIDASFMSSSAWGLYVTICSVESYGKGCFLLPPPVCVGCQLRLLLSEKAYGEPEYWPEKASYPTSGPLLALGDA